ncbi:response regulator [Rhodospirillum rubrum]|uniref:Two component transcriptional regulator, LuxR family n=1 Tax=Rhodospirillum rubrum (strain ATCC 11170 / ATH 1.1.1 / DSM 467 / LMG 4362 / NCIMB 8255 / S1) TaxID=269796 RepID=Q2RS63_RHORT|nr:response regulator transcription factor [Rhodospirillum rubrum]ABC23032.1 two component transcriptional regulator, LuxR family [Rhodospirillum rubrum ATCC 11170]AEO48761.1 two component LuxR family transcriptional regulator [Rhodospirillum rubrum F11]MBK5954659.1 DNA-binding response regulator [Rhodospirillum rubrum]QXG79016.1 response regulator transcription factor [Rhodospirillum rubrum]HAP99654.1 DNA-binding response regulator [Rhodospirillum rubrum]
MRVMIVDDHELFRNGLRFQLAAIDSTLDVVEADTFEDCIRLATEDGPVSKVFLDLMMPDMDWREALSALRRLPDPPDVVVLSGADDVAMIRSAIDHGACGYIPKSLKGDVLESALRLILAGGFYITPEVYRGPRVYDGAVRIMGVGGDDVPLTPRQKEVLAHIDAGLSNRQIAQAMTLSEATVKMHIGRLFKALGAQSRTDALAVARRKGML